MPTTLMFLRLTLISDPPSVNPTKRVQMPMSDRCMYDVPCVEGRVACLLSLVSFGTHCMYSLHDPGADRFS